MTIRGIWTSEFWRSLGVEIVALLALVGVFNPEDVEGIKGACLQTVGAVVLLLSSANYVWARVRVKEGQ